MSFPQGEVTLLLFTYYFYYPLLSRARIMRGLLLKRYAVLLKRYANNFCFPQVLAMRKADVGYLFDSIYFSTYIKRRRT